MLAPLRNLHGHLAQTVQRARHAVRHDARRDERDDAEDQHQRSGRQENAQAHAPEHSVRARAAHGPDGPVQDRRPEQVQRRPRRRRPHKGRRGDKPQRHTAAKVRENPLPPASRRRLRQGHSGPLDGYGERHVSSSSREMPGGILGKSKECAIRFRVATMKQAGHECSRRIRLHGIAASNLAETTYKAKPARRGRPVLSRCDPVCDTE